MRALLLGLARLWLRTLRVHWAAGAHMPERGIIVLWHEQLPICIRAFAGRSIHVLISKSADGEWAARACLGFGYRVHRGSSSRGSLGGLKALARALETVPALAGMALDGPRGPRREAKPGSLWLARHAGVPVVPAFVIPERAIRLGSWDRALIPLPFSRVEVRLGEAFHPQSLEEIEEAMNNLESGAGAESTVRRSGFPSGVGSRESGVENRV